MDSLTLVIMKSGISDIVTNLKQRKMSKKSPTYEEIVKESERLAENTRPKTKKKYTFEECLELGKTAFINGALFVINYTDETVK